MKSNYALNKNNYSTYIPVIHKNIAVGCTIIWPKVKPKLHFVYNNKLQHQLISNSLSLSEGFEFQNTEPRSTGLGLSKSVFQKLNVQLGHNIQMPLQLTLD